jgi:hypothetical protein
MADAEHIGNYETCHKDIPAAGQQMEMIKLHNNLEDDLLASAALNAVTTEESHGF